MNSINVGERNTQFVLDYLRTERITVVSKDVLDIYPRKVCFLPAQRQGHGQAPGLGQHRGAGGAGARRRPAGRAGASSGGSVDLF
jgi:chemotaxis protein CheD